MQEDKKLIVTVTVGGKPVYATHCHTLAGVALMDDVGNLGCFMFGDSDPVKMAATVASLYQLIEEAEAKFGKSFKSLVDEMRHKGKVVK